MKIGIAPRLTVERRLTRAGSLRNSLRFQDYIERGGEDRNLAGALGGKRNFGGTGNSDWCREWFGRKSGQWRELSQIRKKPGNLKGKKETRIGCFGCNPRRRPLIVSSFGFFLVEV